MAKIIVHLLNFHSVASHVAIVVENTSTKPPTFYELDRWKEPKDDWNQEAKSIIAKASSKYSFNIDANPNEIVTKWNNYWKGTKGELLGNNCAVATQWFLSEFADVPQPNISNISVNHVMFGTLWPSLIPCPVLLPGRVMSNAKFYLDARNHPEIVGHYSKLFLYSSITIAAIALTAAARNIASTNPASQNGLFGIISGVSSYVFFKSINLLSAKKIAEEVEERSDKVEDKDASQYS